MKKRRGLLLFQLIIIVGFMFALWLSFGQNVLEPQPRMVVPKQLHKLELVSTVEGDEALSSISKLHGTDIKLTSASILEYARGNERGTVWVGGTDGQEDAEQLIRMMIEGVEKGGDGFTNLQRLTIAGHQVFRIDGPGGDHFFYNSRKTGGQVVWLTLDAADALPIIEEALRNF